MAKARTSNQSAREDKLRQIDHRIWQLRRQRVPAASEQEDLDQPIDSRIQVKDEAPGRYRFELMIDDRLASWLTLIDFTQQVGGATWRMGGIAGVGTDVDFRFRGLSRALMTSSLRWMRQNGFDSSMLYGIPSFYPKFGYVTAFPRTSFCVALRDAETVESNGCRVVEFDPDQHLTDVLRMYHDNNAHIAGPAQRDRQRWDPFRKGASNRTRALPRVLLDERDRCVGYIVFDHVPDAATVIEAGYANENHLGDLVAAAAAHALELRIDTIEFLLPAPHALTGYCQPLGMHQQIVHRRDGGAMVRLVNVPAALEKLAATFRTRLDAARIEAMGLTIQTNLESAGLQWDGRSVAVTGPLDDGQVVQLPQWALAQLCYGLRGADAMLTDGTLHAPRDCDALLQALFPPLPHYFYSVDEF